MQNGKEGKDARITGKGAWPHRLERLLLRSKEPCIPSDCSGSPLQQCPPCAARWWLKRIKSDIKLAEEDVELGRDATTLPSSTELQPQQEARQ